MNIKIRIEDEELFSKKMYATQTINELNKRKIFTVLDFINADLENIFSSEKVRDRYRAYKDVLKYKYLGLPLVTDVLLEREYHNVIELSTRLDKDIGRLGFGDCFFKTQAEKMLNKNGSFKMIDLILDMPVKNEYLKTFYLEYYNTKINNQQEMKSLNEINTSYLSELKNQLNSLLVYRNNVDLTISLLQEQIKNLEEGKGTNGK